MFDVELDIFSGRPNPRWTLTASEEAELLQRLLDRSVPTTSMSITDGKLGYRGFLVRATGDTAATLASHRFPTAFRVRDGLGSQIDPSSERWLLFTAGAASVPGAAADAAASDLSVAGACTTPYHTSTTDFSDWNGSWQWDNNCYNYGANWRTDTFAQPGNGSGTGLHSITIPEVLRCALSDGFKDHCVGKKNRYIKIWFCVWPGTDYHWYRETTPEGGQDRWCHKMGGTPARNTDDSGQPITDPRTADRSSYTSEGIFLYYKGRSNKTVI
jgi:hypothetical protein